MFTKIINRFILSGGVIASIFLVGCSTDGFTRVKTTDGYLNQTKIKLPDRMSEDIGRIVFIRSEMVNKNIPTVFINGRVVGSLPIKRYAETLVCPGEQTIHIGTRTDVIKIGQNQSFTVAPGTTQYLQVYELNGEDFGFRTLTEQEANQLSKGLTESQIINRHQPICNVPLKVLKQINLGADALFKFNSTRMIPAGQARVDKLIQDIQSMGAPVEKIRIIGHTDRLGTVAYNDRLSLGRAKSVADYMKQRGLNIQMETEGRGSREQVTNGCDGLKSKAQLINCLQPDRRVSIELMGSLEQIENKGISSK